MITISSLLLIAYASDIASSRTKIPTVIVLFFLGWLVKQVSILLNLQLPDLEPILSALGTVGLILIVLEGALEIEIEKPKLKLILKSALSAFLLSVLLAIVLSFLFSLVYEVEFGKAFLNSVPFAIISSAIAIPSVSNFPAILKEFVVYETSTSDILGIIYFNFAQNIAKYGFGVDQLFLMLFYLLLMALISILATLGLSFLFTKLKYNVRFTPILLLIILIYSISKLFHLPSLIFILTLGLFVANLRKIDELVGFKNFNFVEIEKDIERFKEIVYEMTFLARSFFFLTFGYVIQTHEIIQFDSIIISVIITALIFVSRFFHLKVLKLPVRPLLYIVPRGLITILLFLSIEPPQNIPEISRSVIIQVIILTNLIMAIGLVRSGKIPDEENLKNYLV